MAQYLPKLRHQRKTADDGGGPRECLHTFPHKQIYNRDIFWKCSQLHSVRNGVSRFGNGKNLVASNAVKLDPFDELSAPAAIYYFYRLTSLGGRHGKLCVFDPKAS
jgi:hypothetical protein